MIPATHITFDGDTAWYVVSSPVDASVASVALDCPCDTCGEDLWQGWSDEGSVPSCDCYGTGRHTFDIEVEAADQPMGSPSIFSHHHVRTEKHRVSIVPGMILPIETGTPNHDCIIFDDDYGKRVWLYWRTGRWSDCTVLDPFPSAAAHGMWAIQLKVATS